jgi:hypothetical protein
VPTSQSRINANRRNCLLSCGPKTTAGRERSKMNAVKHALTSQADVAPGEDPRAFEQLVDGWVDDLNPRNRVEDALVRHAAGAAWRLKRSIHVQTNRLFARVESGSSRDEDDTLGLSRRLFRDRRGPTELYGVVAYDSRGPRTSWSDIVDDPDDPARLVRRLENTAGGLGWLTDRWSELLALLESGNVWQSHHKFKAIRLLGEQPISACGVRPVAEIFVASWAIDPVRENAYAELRSELDDEEHEAFVNRVRAQWPDMLNAGDPEQARRVLISIANRAIERLKEIAAVFDERAEIDQARSIACQSFDDSREGELLRRYETSASRMMLRSLSEFAKLRKATSDSGCDSQQRRSIERATHSQAGLRTEGKGGRADVEKARVDDGQLEDGPSRESELDPAITNGSWSTIENGDTTQTTDIEMITGTDCIDIRSEATASEEAVFRNEANAGDTAVLRNEANAGDHVVSRNEADAGEMAVLRNEADAGETAVLRNEANAGDHVVSRNEADAGDESDSRIDSTQRQRTVGRPDENSGSTRESTGDPETANGPLNPERQPLGTAPDELRRTIMQELDRREVAVNARSGPAARDRIRRRLRGPANKQRIRNHDPGSPREVAPIASASLPPDFSRLLDEVHDELAAERDHSIR